MKILLAVDLSACTEVLVEKAASLAKPLSAKVWIVHVADPEPDFVGYDAGPQSERDAVAERFHKQHKQIQAFAKQLRRDGLDVTALLVQGATVDSILEEIRRLKVDLVVVGTHGHGAMYQLLVGSISEGVIRHADVPVLVVPTRDKS